MRSSASAASTEARVAVAAGVQLKGSLILGRVAYISSHFPNRYAEYLAALQPATRAALEARIMKSNMYPFEMFLDASRTAERLFGEGDYAVVRRMAAHSARVNMPTLYKIFLRFGSPELTMRKVANIWKVQYDSGIASSIPRPEGGGGAIEVREFATPDPLHCNGVTGFMEECLRLVGVKTFQVVHTSCRCDGAAVCRWDATWR